VYNFLIPDEFKLSKARLKRIADERAQRKEEALARAVPWSDDIRWQPLLTIQAKTYQPTGLFDVKPWPLQRETRMPTDAAYFAAPSCESFRYVENVLPRGETLTLWGSRGEGFVAFDNDVVIPTLYDIAMNGGKAWNLAHADPWMSLTPAEMITLRPGTRLAKGHTVVAGLGLGYQLQRVLLRKKVTRVTLVEKSQALVDWLLPRVLARVPEVRSKLDVVVGNAYEVLPKMTADVALVDIYPCFGGNIFLDCANIKKVWVWGSCEPRGPRSLFSYRREPW
jgi:hypothetical protein